MVHVRRMIQEDRGQAACVHRENFPRQTLSYEWITCNFNAFPKTKYFVAEREENLIGYIQWTEKSGFRKEVVLELEQIAVCLKEQGKGVGTALIKRSLPMIEEELAARGSIIKHLLVSTREDNLAKRLYIKTLNARPEALIKNLFSADEVLMLSRDFSSTQEDK